MHTPRTPLDIAGFRPEDGRTLLAPEGRGHGHWVGAASIARDVGEDRVLVAYRDRRPEGRGHRCVVAELSEGEPASLWSMSAGSIGAESIERPALTATPDGRWRLYFSYVEPRTGRWQIDVLEADAPDQFDSADARPVLTAAGTGTEGVKDPYVLHVDGIWFLFVNAVELATEGGSGPRRGVGGDVVLPTGLAISLDGYDFAWEGIVLPVGTTWDARMARLTCTVPLERGHLAFYDGRATVEQNFEEQLGLAYSYDLIRWLRLTPDRPWRRSPHAGGALRYLDAAVDDHTLRLVYEYARPDGAHEMRQNLLPWNPGNGEPRPRSSWISDDPARTPGPA